MVNNELHMILCKVTGKGVLLVLFNNHFLITKFNGVVSYWKSSLPMNIAEPMRSVSSPCTLTITVITMLIKESPRISAMVVNYRGDFI